MQKVLKRKMNLGGLRALRAGLGLMLGLLGATAWAQPINDFFTNAIVLTGPNGVAYGTNGGATLEPGEMPILGFGDQSVWYVWTAPTDGRFQFATRGSDFDTLLGVYTGTNVANLTVLGEHDDVNFPADPTSVVSFNAVAGTAYYISVAAFGFIGVDGGNITLSWRPDVPGLSAGEFSFTSAIYITSERESYGAQSIVMSAAPARATLTRVGGTAGRVLVNYTITNSMYNNLYESNFFGTNVLQDGTLIAAYTNCIVNVRQQNMAYGQYSYLDPYALDVFRIIFQNNNLQFQTNLGPGAQANIISNYFCDNATIGTGTGPNGEAMETNVFCYSVETNLFVPAAIPGADYIYQTNFVIFDDFQMNQDIPVYVFPNNPAPLIYNRVLEVLVTAVTLDPLEPANILQPVVNVPNTLINVHDVDVLPGTGRRGTNIFNFERATLRCRESVGTARVAVFRSTMDASQGTSVPYRIDFRAGDDTPNALNTFLTEAGSDYATPSGAAYFSENVDFTSVTGTLDWGANDVRPKFIEIPIVDDGLVEFNEDMQVQLYFPNPQPTDKFLGYMRTLNLTILFDTLYGGEQPAGAGDRNYNLDNNSGTTPPYNLHPGANSTVYAVAVQPDGRALIAGDFTSYNTTPRNRIARVSTDGQLDASFDPAEGADQFITCMTIESAAEASGKILVGGAFTSFNRIPRLGLARLDANGSLDNSFDPGLGANGTVWQIATTTNGVLVAGEFTQFNGTNRNGIARLARDGSLDTSFDPGVGPNGPVYAVLALNDGHILIGGSFSSVSGVPRSCVARLNADGSLDTTFDPRSGAAGSAPAVYSMALQTDGRVLVAGSFSAMYGLPRNNVARLLANGAIDQSFDPGSGANDVVYDVSVQNSGNILVAGVFTSFNQTRRVGLARLLPYGVVDTSFMDTAYNQFAGVPNHYFNPDIEPRNFIFKTALQGDGNIIIGGGFTRIGGGFLRDAMLERQNVARVIGNATPGPGSIELASSTYSADSYSEAIFVTMMRNNGNLGPGSATVSAVELEPGPGVAISGQDYLFLEANPVWDTSWPDPTWQVQDGLFGQNQGFSDAIGNNGIATIANDVWVTILASTNRGNKELNLEVTKPVGNDVFFLGGENIPLGVSLGRTHASLSIIDAFRNHGVLGFAATNYAIREATTNALITVTRTDGSAGLVTVYAATMNGTATNNIHYKGVTNVLLTFGQGVTNQSFSIPIVDDGVSQYDHTVNLKLYTPANGAVLGVSNAVLTIVDNDVTGGYVQLSAPEYFTNENAGFALITVTRNGSSSSTLAVTLSTSDSNAVSGVNYSGLTTNLTWTSGNIQPKLIAIPIYADGLEQPTNFLNFNVRLSNPRRDGLPNAATLGTVSNAVVTLVNTDFHGSVAFAAVTNRVNEYGGPATIMVVRTGGSAEAIAVNYSVTDLDAFTGVHYLAASGSLLFGVGELSKTFTVPIIDNDYQDPAQARRYATLTLFGATPESGLGFPSTGLLEIVDDESINEPPGTVDTSEDPLLGFNGSVHSLALQPDGRLLVGGDFTEANTVFRNRIARIEPNGSLDDKFSTTAPTAGANDSVLAIVAQSDDRILIGGKFTVVNGLNRNFLARLNLSGTTDSTFNPGAGPDNTVFALVETFVGGDRKLLVGGAFNTFNSLSRPCIVRLNDDGSVDGGFAVGAGANGPVFAVAVQSDGKILIGGDFTAYNNIARNHIARLNVDGSLDTTFDPAAGANGSVRAIAVQPDGHILVGGLFTTVRGQPLNRVARLLPNGTLDATFNPGIGADDAVTTIALQPDTRIILGGQFTRFNGVTRNRLTRLNADGSVDTMINFGTGANSFIAATLVQADSRIAIGGGFTEFNGQPADHFARLYGRSVAGAGRFEFTQAVYEIGESQGGALVTVIRRGGTSASSGGANATVTLATAGGSAVVVSNYSAVVTNLVFPPGEVLQTALIPVRQDFSITPDLTVGLVLSNVAPVVVDGPVLGSLSGAELTILNEDSSVSFSSATYSRNESGQLAIIPVMRSGSTRGYTSVDFMTTTNGTAVADVNYTPVTNTLVFGPGATTVLARVPVLYSPASQGTVTVGLELTNAVNCLLFNPSTAVLSILDVDNLPGDITFAYTNHIVNEGDGLAYVPVLRTNGSSGTISVNYFTVSNTALPGIHYVATNGILSFADGETSKTIAVPLIDNAAAQDEHTTLSVVLTNATAGAAILDPTNTPVTIRDNDQAVKFASYIYPVQESAGSVTLSVLRIGTNGPTTVWYATTNGTAMAGTNYQSASNRLDFVAGESLKTFNISLLRDTNVTGDLSFGVRLFNASAPAQLADPSLATVVLFDQDPGFAFTNAIFGTLKSSNTVVLTVVRSNANTGMVTVNYATANDTAQAGIDYVATSGQLVFSNGVAFQSFTVPLINNRLVEGDRTFSVSLFSPSAGAQLLSPSQASVIITNDISGLAFSAPEYSVSEAGVAASINVVRGGYLESAVSIDYVTADGTARAGVNYLPAAGSLVFTNGETTKTFLVPVIDNSIVEGDKTVLLRLLNPGGNASLLSPNAATLTIIEADGSLILPAGTALTYESGPVNGLIDTNETVTVLFGLRNGSGTNTADLHATLLATNGVLNPSAWANYGVLPVHGPSTSRPFTFSVNGTNGQPISATFALTNGANVSYVAFNFALGRTPSVWSNTAPIVINDHTNATPYPSTITVSGLGGAVVQASVTLTNLKHSAPGDVSMLLVSPAGARTFLMAKAGARNALVNGVTLTFDDTAAAPLPQSSTITSGTYRPTSYAIAPPPFPVPAPPVPYPTNLSVMNGSNPNGTWSLLVIDDTWLDTGVVSNGWTLKLITQGPVSPSSDVGITMTATPSAVVVSNNLTYTLRVTNYGPATASGVVVTNFLPEGVAYVSSTPTASTSQAGVAIWNLGTLAKDGFATLTLVVRPDAAGVIQNRAVVATSSGDPNPDDDSAVLNTTVVSPSANLAIGVAGLPNPIWLGEAVTYSVYVTNFGPAAAPVLALTNTLPAGFTLVSASPGYLPLTGNRVAFPNLGTLGASLATSVSITARPTAPGTFTNFATCASSVTDTNKADNTGSAKTEVLSFQLAMASSGGQLTLAWTNLPNSVLVASTNLSLPLQTWVEVTSPPPSVVGGIKTVTLPIGGGTWFYAVRLPRP